MLYTYEDCEFFTVDYDQALGMLKQHGCDDRLLTWYRDDGTTYRASLLDQWAIDCWGTYSEDGHIVASRILDWLGY